MNHRAPLLCQRWRESRSSYRPAGETINTADYEIAPISKADAKVFVIAHHYSKSFVAARFCYGIFSRYVTSKHWQTYGLAPQLAGVAVYSVPRHPAVLTNVFPGDPNDSVELGRFVLLDHLPSNCETFFISRCNELLKRESIRGVVAFSDPEVRRRNDGTLLLPGHIGTIYSALGKSIFLGRAAPKTQNVFADGTILDRRAISKIRNHESGFNYASKLLTSRGADEPWPNSKNWLDHWLPKLTTSMRHRGTYRFAWPIGNVIPRGTPLPYPKQFATANEMLAAKEEAANQQPISTTENVDSDLQ